MNRWTRRALTGSLLLCAPALPAHAQEQPAPPAEPVPVRYRASIEYNHVRFDADLDPWHLMSVEGSRRSGAGTILLRGTGARRFGQTGQQAELEAYPRLTSRTYGFLNLGYSPSEIFPTWRYGAELFANLGAGVEASGGVRHLRFDTDDVTLYTASLGKYLGNYYGVLRPTLASNDGEVSLSGDLLLRRYSGDAHEHVTLRLGGGESPGEQITAFELERLSSRRASLDGVVALRDPVGLRWSLGVEGEELPGERSRARFSLGIGLQTRF